MTSETINYVDPYWIILPVLCTSDNYVVEPGTISLIVAVYCLFPLLLRMSRRGTVDPGFAAGGRALPVLLRRPPVSVLALRRLGAVPPSRVFYIPLLFLSVVLGGVFASSVCGVWFISGTLGCPGVPGLLMFLLTFRCGWIAWHVSIVVVWVVMSLD